MRLHIELFGSLGATGYGHGSDSAVIVGLYGHLPDQVDCTIIPTLVTQVRSERKLQLLERHALAFDPEQDISI